MSDPKERFIADLGRAAEAVSEQQQREIEAVARALSALCVDGCEHRGDAREMRACVDPPCPCRQFARAAIAALDRIRAEKK